jgi:hypothetical protein
MRVAAILAAAMLALPPPPAAGSDLRRTDGSALLPRGASELKLFHNVYTQTSYFDGSGHRTDQGGRSTWYTGTAALRLGWTDRANAGLEVTVRAVRDDTRPSDFATRRGLTAVSPRIQVIPLAGRPSLTLAGALRLPLGADLEGDSRDPFLDFGHPVASLTALQDLWISPTWRVHLEAGGALRMASDESQLGTPLLAMVHLEAFRRWTPYGTGQASRDWLGESGGDYGVQAGLGAKIYPGDGGAEIEVLWTTFPLGRNSGAGQTFNLGLRFVR